MIVTKSLILKKPMAINKRQVNINLFQTVNQKYLISVAAFVVPSVDQVHWSWKPYKHFLTTIIEIQDCYRRKDLLKQLQTIVNWCRFDLSEIKKSTWQSNLFSLPGKTRKNSLHNETRKKKRWHFQKIELPFLSERFFML